MLIVAIATLGLFPATPAAADHAYGAGWWGNPPVVWSDGNYTANVQDAAYYWEWVGFDGYYPPLPGVPQPAGAYCAGNYQGVITVCTVSRSIVQAYCGEPCDGHARTYYYIGTNRIQGAFILVANDLSPYRRQQVWRHEWGHVIGLGHTSDPSCIMHKFASAPNGTGCTHDTLAIQNTMYPGDRW